jgi:hypothetical protein
MPVIQFWQFSQVINSPFCNYACIHIIFQVFKLNGKSLPKWRARNIGVRMEKRMVKVLKALAEYHDISLGDLLEGIVLHAFENVTPFGEETLQRIAQLKEVYGMDYGVSASHRFTEQTPGNDDRNGE